MNVRNNDVKLNLHILLIPIALVLAAFSPPLSFVFCLISLFVLGVINYPKKKVLFYAFTFFAGYNIVISSLSNPLFLYTEQDFTTYYNNYLLFLVHGFNFDFFYFGHGFEVGLPLLNFILSVFINAPQPYVVKLCYIMIQLGLLFCSINLISQYLSLSFNQVILLFAFSLLFFKYGATLNHLRQGFSSLFIVLALFSRKYKYKYIFIFLACCFHVTAIVVYPLSKFLLFERSAKKLVLFSCLSIILGISIFFAIPLIISFVISLDFFLFEKLIWGLTKAKSSAEVVTYLKVAFTASIYLIPLILIGFYSKLFYNFYPKLFFNVISIFVFVLSFSFIPGLTVRTLAGIFTLLIGYLYFSFFYYDRKLKNTQASFFSIILIIIFSLNWIFLSPIYYYRYPLASVIPFYYFNDLLEKHDEVDRTNLPSENDLKIINPYR